jgi:plastocyanin
LAVRVSELPVVTTLNDDDFIIVNTQNIVTQGIETEFFITSLFGRNLEFTGNPIFVGDVTYNGDSVINGELTVNNNVTLNGDFSVNGSVSINIGELNDVNVAAATAGQFLAYNAGTSTWVAVDTPGAKPSGNEKTFQFKDGTNFGGAPEVTYGNTSNGNKGVTVVGTSSNLELTGARVNSTGTLNLDASSNIIIKSPEVKIQNGSSDRITVNISGVKLDGTTTSSDLIVTSSFVASGINYPTSDGTLGQVITTDGNGNLTFETNEASQGISLTDLSVEYESASETSNLTYDNTSGVLTFTPNIVSTPGTTIPFQSDAPVTTTPGDLWMNSTTYELFVWDGSWIGTVTGNSLPSAEDVTLELTGADGTIAYQSAGGNNETVNIEVGGTLTIINNSGGHPVIITGSDGGTSTIQGTITGDNPAGDGQTLVWDTTGVTSGTFYYQCQDHPAMIGTINLTD